MENWLRDRLSPVKSETNRWVELAEAIQQLWEENFDSYLSRQVGFRSIFTAVDKDKQRILSELGKYYDIDIQDNNIPIAVVQRRVELFQKDSLVPLTASFRRACPGIDIRWKPEYARHGTPYGSLFYTEQMLKTIGKTSWLTIPVNRLDGTWKIGFIPPLAGRKLIDAVFLTSRGQIWVDENSITNPSLTEERIRNRIELFKPLHIVLDGIIWDCCLRFPSLGTVLTAAVNSYRKLHIFGGLWVNGGWRIGLDERNMRLDGTWKLDGTVKIGYLCFKRVVHKRLGNYRSRSSGTVDAYCNHWLTSRGYPRLMTVQDVIKLDGTWGVGRPISRPLPWVMSIPSF